jgi:hypothetical protein
MPVPAILPDWAPAWVQLAALVILLLVALLFLAVPFSVIGLKGRLDGVEARLDEVHAEIRSLNLRLPEVGDAAYPPDWVPPERLAPRPPIPPAPRGRGDGRAPRTEPRLS